MVGTSESNLKYAMLLLPKKSLAKFKPAKHAFIDEINNPRLCALIMVILGCDFYITGMTGVSVTTLAKMIDTVTKEMADDYSKESLFVHRCM
jgi:hypothetical protein